MIPCPVTVPATRHSGILDAEPGSAPGPPDGWLGRERDRLRLLLEVSEAIASHRNLDDLFKDLAERLPRVVPFDYINVLLHDQAHDVLRLRILVAPEESTIKPGLELPVDGSITGFVWKTQQPVMIADLTTELRFPGIVPLLLENGVRSVCALPLTSPLRRLGTLGFGSLTPRAYAPAELDFMRQVANQVAVAVDNVLHDESARLAQQGTGAGTRSAPGAARGQQCSRGASRHGPDVCGDQREPVARDPA